MLKPVLVLLIAMSCCWPRAQAAEAGVATAKALHTIVAAQRIEEKYRAYLDSSASRHAAIMQKIMEDSVLAAPQLSQAQRQKALALLPAWSASLAADLRTRDRAMDLAALVREMAHAVYPSYFSEAELGELAAFYASSAYRKTIEIGARIKEDERRSGVRDPHAWDKYQHLFTEAENDTILANGASAVGKKLARVNPALNKDIMTFFGARTTDSIKAMADAHTAQFVATMNAGTPP